jgi:CBS domain-containing protein
MKVQEVMTKTVRFCNPETNLAEAATILWDADCGLLPVVDEAKKVVGVISDRDICIAVATKGKLASEITVQEVFNAKPVYSCTTDDQLPNALHIMQQHQVRRLPIVDRSGTLQGILSVNDVILAATDKARSGEQGVSLDDAIATLQAICEHRTSDQTSRQKPRTAQA